MAGDVLIASAASENGAPSPPSGWTAVPNLDGSVTDGQRMITWYKVATGSEPANYQFTTGGSAIAANVAAFTGASLTTPVNPGAAQTIIGSATTSATLPNANGSYADSMRYSAAMSDDDAGTTSFSGGMSSMCSVSTAQSSDVGFGAAYQTTGVGATPDRTVSVSDNGRMVLHTLVINPACTGGSLSLASPAVVTFPGVTLNGLNQTVPAVGAFDVTDDTGANAGWSISATSTTFTNGARTFPTNATRITGAAATANVGTCSAPTNGIAYPVVLPAAAVAPPAVKVFNAAAGSGRGTHDVDISHSLQVPSSASTGTYSSTWTWTIATGP